MVFRRASAPRRHSIEPPAGFRLALIAVVTLGVVATFGGCSDDTPTSSALDQLAPTRAEIASAAGFGFPRSVKEFRVARISGNSVNVSFRIDPDEVDDFASGSGLRLEPRRRVIIHVSPLWPLNPQGALSGGSDTFDGIRRDVEVVSGDGPSTVRISLRTG